MNKIVNGYEFPDLDWVHHDSKTINEDYYKVINGTALYYENYVKQLQNRITELEEINKQHQELNGMLNQEINCLKEEIKQWKKKYGNR